MKFILKYLNTKDVDCCKRIYGNHMETTTTQTVEETDNVKESSTTTEIYRSSTESSASPSTIEASVSLNL